MKIYFYFQEKGSQSLLDFSEAFKSHLALIPELATAQYSLTRKEPSLSQNFYEYCLTLDSAAINVNPEAYKPVLNAITQFNGIPAKLEHQTKLFTCEFPKPIYVAIVTLKAPYKTLLPQGPLSASVIPISTQHQYDMDNTSYIKLVEENFNHILEEHNSSSIQPELFKRGQLNQIAPLSAEETTKKYIYKSGPRDQYYTFTFIVRNPLKLPAIENAIEQLAKSIPQLGFANFSSLNLNKETCIMLRPVMAIAQDNVNPHSFHAQSSQPQQVTLQFREDNVANIKFETPKGADQENQLKFTLPEKSTFSIVEPPKQDPNQFELKFDSSDSNNAFRLY